MFEWINKICSSEETEFSNSVYLNLEKYVFIVLISIGC